MKRINENTEINYTSETELSYIDNSKKDVILLINDKEVGKIEVWHDSDNDNREYIILENTIVYLDCITKK